MVAFTLPHSPPSDGMNVTMLDTEDGCTVLRKESFPVSSNERWDGLSSHLQNSCLVQTSQRNANACVPQTIQTKLQNLSCFLKSRLRSSVKDRWNRKQICLRNTEGWPTQAWKLHRKKWTDFQSSLIKQLWLSLMYKRERQLLTLTLLYYTYSSLLWEFRTVVLYAKVFSFISVVFWRGNSARYSLLTRAHKFQGTKKQRLFLQQRHLMLVWFIFEQLIWNSPSLKNLGSFPVLGAQRLLPITQQSQPKQST